MRRSRQTRLRKTLGVGLRGYSGGSKVTGDAGENGTIVLPKW